MKVWICLLMTVSLLSAAPKKTAAKRQVDVACVDTPRVVARKKPVKKLERSETMKQELSGVLFGVSLNDRLELNIDMEAPTEEGASQLEKMAGVLAEAQQLKSQEGATVIIDLPKAARVSKNGKVVRTTVSLSDAQLEKLLEARYGRRLVSEAKLRLVYVHGLPGGTKSYPFGDSVNVDLSR